MSQAAVSPSFQLTGRQQVLYQSLAQKSAAMGELYECGLRAFQDSANPGRIFLAAHSIREMTKDLPKVLDVPVLTDHGRMRDRLDAMENLIDEFGGATEQIRIVRSI